MTTIYALSSGHGKAGLAVIRISGTGAGSALKALAGDLPPPREAVLRTLRAPASCDILDRSLIIWFPSPASFTGEDIAELHIHGGRAVIAGDLLHQQAVCHPKCCVPQLWIGPPEAFRAES